MKKKYWLRGLWIGFLLGFIVYAGLAAFLAINDGVFGIDATLAIMFAYFPFFGMILFIPIFVGAAAGALYGMYRNRADISGAQSEKKSLKIILIIVLILFILPQLLYWAAKILDRYI